MLVVSDATPLNILIRADLVHILPAMFDLVIIPPAVHRELTHPNTPTRVRAWLESPPPWLEIRAASCPLGHVPRGQGEREAITLAQELKADLLLADDKAARRTAISLDIPTIGTLGLLEQAAARNLIVLRPSVERIRSEGLFLSSSLVRSVLARDAERNDAKDTRGEHGPSASPGPSQT